MIKNPDLKKLGNRIAKIRQDKGFSQDELALEAEIGRRTINRIEVGDTDARYTTLIKIAKTLGVKVRDLVDY